MRWKPSCRWWRCSRVVLLSNAVKDYLTDVENGSWSYCGLERPAMSEIRRAVASMSLGGSGTQQAMKDAGDALMSLGTLLSSWR